MEKREKKTAFIPTHLEKKLRFPSGRKKKHALGREKRGDSTKTFPSPKKKKSRKAEKRPFRIKAREGLPCQERRDREVRSGRKKKGKRIDISSAGKKEGRDLFLCDHQEKKPNGPDRGERKSLQRGGEGEEKGLTTLGKEIVRLGGKRGDQGVGYIPGKEKG